MRPLATISTLFLAANLLNARSVITDTLLGKPKTVDTTPGEVTIRFESQLMTDPIQNLVLDPLRVIRIPVSRDRVTTVRFPSPISDFVSAAVATEPHPEAKFRLLPQPGTGFFSVQALVTNASTSLNVLWKSQTFVFELVESSTPWLSVSLSAPEEPKAARMRSKQQNAVPTNVWLQFIESAKSIHNRRPFSYGNTPGVVSLPTDGKIKVGNASIDIQEGLLFKDDEILVLRVVFESNSNGIIRFNPSGTTFTAEGRSITYLTSDFDGVVTPSRPVVAYFVARAPKYERTDHNKMDTITVNFAPMDGPSPPAVGKPTAVTRVYSYPYPVYTNYEAKPKW